MGTDTDGSWSRLSNGPHVVAYEFAAPSIEAALGRAVEGFADAVVDVHPSTTTARHAAVLTADTPSALLLAVLEECLRCGKEGRIPVALVGPALSGSELRTEIDTVPADDPHVHGELPHVLSWHELTMETDPDGGWKGRVVAGAPGR